MEIIRFATVGVLNTTVGLSLIYMFMGLFDMNYIAANAFGYAAGFILSFSLNKSWTFRHSGTWITAGMRWLLVIGISYGLNLGSVVIAHTFVGVSASLAQLIGVVIYSVASFLGGRYFAFAPHETKRDQRACAEISRP
jgi:putative flippase GtrA